MPVVFTSYVGQTLDALAQAKLKALKKVGGVAVTDVMYITPRVTGNLMNSIAAEMYDENTIAIGTEVKYAPFVELGTIKMKAKPYLRPAIENNLSKYKEIIRRELEGK